MHADRERASNWYWWLWLSPILTIPTFIVFLIIGLGHDLLCSGPGRCNWSLAEHLTLITSIIASSLWHLILLKPALEKDRPFLHWHGLQALCLAGIRTAVPVLIVVIEGVNFSALIAIPILIIIWFFGTYYGQRQATRGRCTLAIVAGREDELVSKRIPKPMRTPIQKRIKECDPEDWVAIIRFSDDPKERRRALAALMQLGLTEEF